MVLAFVVSTMTLPFAARAEANQTYDLQENVSKVAASVINKDGKNFETKQLKLQGEIKLLSKAVKGDSELENEVKILKNTLSETKILFKIRKSLRQALKAEPTSQELMKSYFELKAIGAI